MLLNFGRCKCLHTRHGNLHINYTMGDIVLGTTVKETDLGGYFNLAAIGKTAQHAFFGSRLEHSALLMCLNIFNVSVTFAALWTCAMFHSYLNISILFEFLNTENY